MRRRRRRVAGEPPPEPALGRTARGALTRLEVGEPAPEELERRGFCSHDKTLEATTDSAVGPAPASLPSSFAGSLPALLPRIPAAWHARPAGPQAPASTATHPCRSRWPGAVVITRRRRPGLTRAG